MQILMYGPWKVKNKSKAINRSGVIEIEFNLTQGNS